MEIEKVYTHTRYTYYGSKLSLLDVFFQSTNSSTLHTQL